MTISGHHPLADGRVRLRRERSRSRRCIALPLHLAECTVYLTLCACLPLYLAFLGIGLDAAMMNRDMDSLAAERVV